MIRRWTLQCDTCGDTDPAHEMPDGDMVHVEDLVPLIERLRCQQTLGPVSDEAELAHNRAVDELRALLLP